MNHADKFIDKDKPFEKPKSEILFKISTIALGGFCVGMVTWALMDRLAGRSGNKRF